ncbi:hypothetical protein Nepgr_010379 [Nepenthes gracilis]|uniref:Cupin type-1 domain-containing protein n=1 Tax=Nepenthes gracilis TaxID=150966 RepID=A0AAD3SD83_NEPGR|nr:hypothetical protein Nepgr_010379 [Nepenthes gracilis]
MATKISLLSLFICLLAICPSGSFVQGFGQGPWQRQQGERFRHRQQREECDIRMLNAAVPTQRLQAEAGVTEYWDPDHQQFRCAGVVPVRHVLEPKGLLLPFYANAPHLTYVVQGMIFFYKAITIVPVFNMVSINYL